MKTHPITSRIDDDANKALKILEAPDGKTRTSVLSAAIMALYNGTIASAPLKLDLLDPSEILTLQSEVAAVEKLHRDNRAKAKIRTFDKNATEKIIKAVEKIDAETEELEKLRLKLGRLAQLPESVGSEDLESLKSLATALKDCAKQIADCHDKIAQSEVERDEARAECAAVLAKTAAQKARWGSLLVLLEPWNNGDTKMLRGALSMMTERIERTESDSSEMPYMEFVRAILTSLLP
jgi:chromosome segregation ATPase